MGKKKDNAAKLSTAPNKGPQVQKVGVQVLLELKVTRIRRW